MKNQLFSWFAEYSATLQRLRSQAEGVSKEFRDLGAKYKALAVPLKSLADLALVNYGFKENEDNIFSSLHSLVE